MQTEHTNMIESLETRELFSVTLTDTTTPEPAPDSDPVIVAKASFQDMKFMHRVDKSSPVLMLASA